MPCRLGLSGNQKSSGHHSQKSAMNYRCSMVPKISYQFLGVQKKMLRYSNWNGIFMDFFMDFHGLLHAGISAIPQKKTMGVSTCSEKVPAAGRRSFASRRRRLPMAMDGLNMSGKHHQNPMVQRRTSIFQHIFISIYIYICALVNRPSQVPQLSKKTIEMLFFFHGRSPEIEPLDIFRHL